MKVLFLGPEDSPLVEWLKSVGEDVTTTMDPIDAAFLNAHSPEFIVSYGYRYIIKGDVLDRYPNRAINLHISYLPWNRGADPNFWRLVDDTPKGLRFTTSTGASIPATSCSEVGDVLRDGYPPHQLQQAPVRDPGTLQSALASDSSRHVHPNEVEETVRHGKSRAS